MNSSEIGQIGEDIACKYLKSIGHKILGRNIRIGRDELDIVSRETSSGILCFVEVKCLSLNKAFIPENHFNKAKRLKFRRIVQLFHAKHQDMVTEAGIRMDLLSISINSPLLDDWRKDCDIRHYKNV